MRSVRITLLVGLVALAVSVGVALSHASARLAGSNDVDVTAVLRETPTTGGRFCQDGELLPRGTAAVRLFLRSDGGPPLAVAAVAGGRTVAQGRLPAGWGGTLPRIGLHPAVRRDVPVSICVRIGAGGDRVDVLGTPSGGTAPGRMRIDELRAGRESWWSLLPTLVARLGRGHAWSGPSVAIVAAALALAAVALALRALLRVETSEEP